jgi:hypothetical protein
MKAQELQIGNYVYYNSFVCKVYAVSCAYPNENERYNDKETVDLLIDGIITVAIDEIEPIPLTEDWKKKFGFVLKEPSITYVWKFAAFGETKTINFEFVHQLQNFIALTGEELKV